MVLSGIRPSFPSLSRSTGQITHVLLTRSPLEHPHHKNDAGLSVRLACVKHAASVRPEPGSNSPKKQTKNNNRQKTKKPTKQKQTNTKNHSVPAFMFIYKQSLLHQMTHYRVLKQHHHPQPNTQDAEPQTATTQIYKPHHKTTNHHVTTTKTGKNYTKFASLHS